MVRPLTPLTASGPHVPLRDVEGDDPAAIRRARRWERWSRRWYVKALWTVLFVVAIPVAMASIWAFDYVAVAAFGGFGALLRPVVELFFERLYVDD